MTAGALVGTAGPAFAASTGTVTAGQGNEPYINQRSAPHLAASTVGQANIGSAVNMQCQTQGDTVENDARWIWSGSFYIADAFIAENTDSLPTCGGAVTLNISMQKQVQDEMVLDASGLTIAMNLGYTQYSQSGFGQLAHQYSGVSCNDQPATLHDMAPPLWETAASPTPATTSTRSATSTETATRYPTTARFAVRIGWAAGGGHMNVIYGYDPSSNMIAVGDPWPSTQTYTWWNTAVTPATARSPGPTPGSGSTTEEGSPHRRNHHRTGRWAARLASLAVGAQALSPPSARRPWPMTVRRPGPAGRAAGPGLRPGPQHRLPLPRHGRCARQRRPGHAGGRHSRGQRPAVAGADTPVALYELSPDFVKGTKPATAGNLVAPFLPGRTG